MADGTADGAARGASLLRTEKHEDASRALLRHFSIAPAGPVENFLSSLMDRYTTIPYENLSKIVRREAARTEEERLRLPGEVLRDFLERGLGGTCFSLSYYLLCVLHAAGLPSYVCMAHMGRRRNVHCVIVADAPEGKYMLDPGYVIAAPVPLRRNVPVRLAVPHTFVLLRYDPVAEAFELSTGGREGMKRRYWFQDVPVSLADFYAHWQRSFTMDTLNDICLTMRRGDSLVYLHGNYFRETRIGGARKERLAGGSESAIRELLGVEARVVEEARAGLLAYEEEKRCIHRNLIR
jgi:arylamine N-acetyltransferase